MSIANSHLNEQNSHQNGEVSIPAHQEQGSIVEPRTVASVPPTEEMFLSPRVIDASAFARYSDTLKGIITQASAQTRSLEDFTTDAQAMITRCEQAGENINVRLQAGVRMLKMIDERAQRTDLLLDKVQAAQPNAELLSKQIDAMIEQRLSNAESRIEQVMSDALEKIEQAEQRTQKALELSEGYAQQLSSLTSTLDGQMNELESRIELTRQDTQSVLKDILDRTEEINKELSTSMDQIVARSHEAGANLAAKVDEASNLTDARIEQISQQLNPILDASAQAMRTLGMDPENPNFNDSPLARIEQLVERGETQSASLDRVYRQFEDLQSQAQEIRASFGNWLVDAAGELDVLEARKDTLVGPISDAADKVANVTPELGDQLEIASTKIDHLQIEQKALRQAIEFSSTVADEVSARMTNESGQLQALLDGSLHKLSTRVEQAGVWLGALIQRAESIGAQLPEAGRMEFGQPTQTTPTPVPVPTPVPTPTAAPAPQSAPVAPNPVSNPESTQPTNDVQSTGLMNEAENRLQSDNHVSDVAPVTSITDEFTAQTPKRTSGISEPLRAIQLQEQTQEHKSLSPVTDELGDQPTSAKIDLPPCLPIDSISFDGSSMVIEHNPTDPSSH